MTTQMQVDLPPEKARQCLLKYFETREDIEVRRSELDSLLVRIHGWRPPPWIDIEIGMFKEGNKTRLGFNFDLRIAYVIITIATMICIPIFWCVSLIRPENVGLAIGFMLGILIFAPISFASEISRAKRKFLDDIRKAFDQLNKTRNLFSLKNAHK